VWISTAEGLVVLEVAWWHLECSDAREQAG
jgi:hypothetical protein